MPKTNPRAEKPEPRPCACGCGKIITPKRPWHRFATPACRWRAWRQEILDDQATAATLRRRMLKLRKLAAIDGPITAEEMDARLKKIDRILERGYDKGHVHK